MQITRTTALFGLLMTLVSGSALAVDGVIEINQARALAGGVTEGDEPGFPVTISDSGSYILTGNLDVPVDTSGIVIVTDDVAVDLNGFTIAGNGGTEGDGVTAFNASTTSFHRHITVRNGVVRGMGGNGILGGDPSRVEAIHAQGNGGNGIGVRGGTVIANTAAGNGSDGISAFVGSTVANNTVSNNGDKGIAANSSCTVTGNSAFINGDTGISAGLGSTVIGNNALGNGLDGILASDGSTVTNNTVSDNDRYGIFANSGSTVIGNTALNNTNFGLFLDGDPGYKDNVLTGNNDSSNPNDQVSGGVQIGNNLCSGVLCGSGE